MSEPASSRVRWNPEELSDLARVMASELAARPRIRLLEALRTAQDKVLLPDRRREIKAWSVVQPRLESLLNEAQAALESSGRGAAATSGPVNTPAAAPADAAARNVIGEIEQTVIASAASVDERISAGEGLVAAAASVASSGSADGTPAVQRPQIDAAALGSMLANVFETSLLVALQSRHVEDAFASMIAKASARSVDERSLGSRHERDSAKSSQRVLLAGFDPSIAKGIEEQLRDSFDIRRWAPSQGPQMLDTLTRMCSVVVIPDEAEEETGQAFSGRDLQVVRHSGNTQRLAERLSTILS